MKNFIKKLAKKAEGFTLVELVVVIAILGILAGVAVPAYSGYLEKAKEAGDITTLEAVKTAAMAYNAKNGAVTKVFVDKTDDGYTVQINSNANTSDDISTTDDFKLYFANGGTVSFTLNSTKFANGAKWESGVANNEWVAY